MLGVELAAAMLSLDLQRHGVAKRGFGKAMQGAGIAQKSPDWRRSGLES